MDGVEVKPVEGRVIGEVTIPADVMVAASMRIHRTTILRQSLLLLVIAVALVIASSGRSSNSLTTLGFVSLGLALLLPLMNAAYFWFMFRRRPPQTTQVTVSPSHVRLNREGLESTIEWRMFENLIEHRKGLIAVINRVMFVFSPHDQTPAEVRTWLEEGVRQNRQAEA